MSSAFGAASQIVRPPEKGSFPLDHYGECKEQMKSFLECMKDTKGKHRDCKQLSKLYLECRMEKELMAKENLEKLGFGDYNVTIKESNEGRKEAEGFVSGLGVKTPRYK